MRREPEGKITLCSDEVEDLPHTGSGRRFRLI